jgi:hypothetical protein
MSTELLFTIKTAGAIWTHDFQNFRGPQFNPLVHSACVPNKSTRITPVWHNTPINFRKEKHISVRFIQTLLSLSCLQDVPTKWYDLDLWPLTLKNKFGSPSHHGDQVYQIVWSWSLQFGFYFSFKVFLLRDATTLTFDLEK